jgi:radical SAM superfamily enzyme YgiQ (UPF0313 family)
MPAAQVTLAGAIPAGLDVEPVVVDEAIARFDAHSITRKDVVCISALTNNCREAYRVAKQAKDRGASVVMGGPHPTLLPEEALAHGADAVVKGDGDTILGRVLEDIFTNRIAAGGIYQTPDGEPFRAVGHEMAYPRLDLVDLGKYCTASIRSDAGCIHSCTFCTVPMISGRFPRARLVEDVAREIRELHDGGIRFGLWGADNLVQYPLSVVKKARNSGERQAAEAEREKSLTFFRQLTRLVGEKGIWGFAQLTLQLHDDAEMLAALRDAWICAALFGIETVDPEALRRMAKQWNGTRAEMIEKVQRIQASGIHVLGSTIVGLPTDTAATIEEMRKFSVESGMSVAQFPLMDILPGSPDYTGAKRAMAQGPLTIVTGQRRTVKLLRDNYWLEPEDSPPHLQHPNLSSELLKMENRRSWRYFYKLSHLLRNSIRRKWPVLRIITYVVVCKGFAAFYSGSVGLSADSVRNGRSSVFQKKLMALGVWLMHNAIPPPRSPKTE